jgi:tetratricopeptide (TPR) repeat protein
MRSRLLALLALLLAAPACSAPPPRPAATAAQRLNGEGLRRLERGDEEGAEQLFRDALREAELVDDLLAEAEAWNNLGALAAARGDARGAWASHAAALRLHQARGVRDKGEVRTRTNLGGAMLLAGEAEPARIQFTEAVALARALGDPGAGRMAQVGLAAARLRQNQAPAAREEAAQAAASARAADDQGALGAALSIEGAALEIEGRLDEARARYDEALAIDRQREQPAAVAEGLRSLARVAEKQGDRQGAAALLGRGARALRRLGRLDEAEADLARAITLAGPGPEAEALEAERKAIQGARAAGGR